MTAHNRIRELARDILGDLAILAGDNVGPSGASWHDVAGTCATNARVLASLLDELRSGATHFGGGRFPVERPLVFPSMVDLPAPVVQHHAEPTCDGWWWARERKTQAWQMARVAFPRPSPRGDDVLIPSPVSGFSNTLRNRRDFDAWVGPLLPPDTAGVAETPPCPDCGEGEGESR